MMTVESPVDLPQVAHVDDLAGPTDAKKRSQKSTLPWQVRLLPRTFRSERGA